MTKHDNNTPDKDEHASSEFARQAEQRNSGVIREFWDYLQESRKWWMIPIVASLLVAGAVLILGSSAVAPFIYTLF